MKKAIEYREHARECLDMANVASDPEKRTMLLKMAETWEGLAKDREAHLAAQERIAALETKDLSAK